jgi:hypothetical protein
VFTAISGSAGALLRFSTASGEQIDANPIAFVDALRQVAIPPDCLFTVRFGGGTWHQFLPLQPKSKSPALFALSCHTNELGGNLPENLRSLVEADSADIPTLTEVLPESIQALLRATDPDRIPTVAMSLHAAPVSFFGRLCAASRRWIGPLRGLLSRVRPNGGFLYTDARWPAVVELSGPPVGSLLCDHLIGEFHHQDFFTVNVSLASVQSSDASKLLVDVLEGFLQNRPQGVTWLMALRNFLVKPLRLRTSPLGCPVSSLLAPCTNSVFAHKYPVLDQRVDANGKSAQVLLGADDRHLRFRSCVGVEITTTGATITLGTRVQTLNLFGRVYLSAIDRVHRRYVSPAMLRLAVDHALRVELQPIAAN